MYGLDQVDFRIMELLKSPKMTFKGVSELTGVSVQTVVRVFDHHTHIPRVPFPQAICIDEVYTKVIMSMRNSPKMLLKFLPVLLIRFVL